MPRRNEGLLNKKNGLIATGAAVGALALGVFGLPDIRIPGFGKPKNEINKIESKSRLNDIRLTQKVILVEGRGETETSIDAELKYTGIRSPLNILPERSMHTEVTQPGTLQMGFEAGGIVVDRTNPAAANMGDPVRVRVDVSKIFSQVAEVGEPKIEADDGKLVEMRSVFHEDESKREERVAELETLGREYFSNTCSPVLKMVLGAGIREWVEAQDALGKNQSMITSYINGDASHPVDLNAYQLPKESTKTPEQITQELYGSGSNVEIKDASDGDCHLSSRVVDQIKQINGDDNPENNN